MIKRNSKGMFIKGSSNPWNKDMKGWTNSGSFTSKGTKGENNLFYGCKHTDIAKEKIGEAGKGRSAWNKGGKGLYHHTKESKQKLRIAVKKRVELGVHNFYKGGISRAYKQLKHSLRNKEWRDWREKIFKRDNYTCQNCGARSRAGKAIYLHPHHIFSVADCIKENKLDLIYEITNGKTLCIDCHKFVHKNKLKISSEVMV